MTDTIQRLAALEDTGYAHESRLLILIHAFTLGNASDGIRGMTKLAKLDFLLRYPTYLERALKARGASTRSVKVREHERSSVEARMVRYRFGPWDHRYPEVLRTLNARGLIALEKDGQAVMFRTTRKGSDVAEVLRSTGDFVDISARSEALRTHLNLTATNLMKFIYETFPEVVSLRSNQEIGT
jgi:hypothetical protein